MSYDWTEGVEDYIATQIETYGLDPKAVWEEVIVMAQVNLEALDDPELQADQAERK
jgi:hypothetical protein